MDCLDISENDAEKSKVTDEQAHENLCKTPGKLKVLRTKRRERPKKLFHYRTDPVIGNKNQEDLEKRIIDMTSRASCDDENRSDESINYEQTVSCYQ